MISLKQFLKENSEENKKSDANHAALVKQRFNPKQIASLDYYTNDSYPINSALWIKRKLKVDTLVDEEKNHMKNIDSAIKNNKIPHEVDVYSGIQYDPRKRINRKGIVHHPAYLSTSLEKNVAQGFARFKGSEDKDENGNLHSHTIHIKVPEGHPGAYLGHHRFEKNDEREVLLPRGLNLRHIHTEDSPVTSYLGKPTINHIHHMEIVK